MNKLPKCPKCGGTSISCLKPVKDNPNFKFVFSHYICLSCDYEWNPEDTSPEKVVFT